MISLTTPTNCSVNCMLSSSSFSSSAVVRRHLFLLRTLGAHMERRQNSAVSAAASEADAESVIRRLTPALDPARHKGQAGKVAVIGGCREYTGAPYFAALSALKIGADLSHVFCTKDAAPVIKSYSPELIVHPVLEESYNVRNDEKASISAKVLAEVAKWMERFDCLVVGPGLGRDPFLLDCVSDIIKLAQKLNVPMVIDGDGLFLVTNNVSLVSGYPLAILTPNVNEYKRLVEKVLNCEIDDRDAAEQLEFLSRQMGGVTILRKGKSDLISDGKTVNMVNIFGSPRRCGGQGDILSGRFEGTMIPSSSQAALLTFCTCISLASVGLVLSIAVPEGGNNWFWLTVLSPLAGVYYWQRASRKEEIKVKMLVGEDGILSEIVVRGDDQQVEQMRKELQLSEKGMIYVKGIFET